MSKASTGSAKAGVTEYACVYILATAEEDHFKRGCLPSTQRCVMSEPVNIVASSLPELLSEIRQRYRIDLDDLWLPEETLDEFSYNRLELDNGHKPTPNELRLWKKGQLKMFLVDYHFRIEKRVVTPVDRSEFDAAKIKYHE